MYQELLIKQKAFYQTEQTKSYRFRIEQLNNLYQAINLMEESIIEALNQDLCKSIYESYITEIGVVKKDITHMKSILKSLMKPKSVRSGLALFKSKSMLYQEPYGNVLIISPWNYPFQLAMAPLIGAIAAGNTACIKVSEDSPNVSRVTAELIEKTFKPEYITVIQGGINESEALLNLPFNYIFFTGSPRVGKIVMNKASNHLTPVTLELGGKSPVVIVDTNDIDLTAKRIAYGKFINAGQTCIAPDYVWIRSDLKEAFIVSMKKAIEETYGNHPIESKDYPKIINKKHYDRLMKLIDSTKVVYGGNGNGVKLSPTLLDDITWNDEVMNDEIFGPILPILTFDSYDDVIHNLKQKDKPLAFYLFTEDKNIKNQFISELSFGGMTINDTIMHFANIDFPFGGIGNSGMGAYHGKHSFYTFSHQKGILDRSTRIDVKLRYMKSSERKLKIVKHIMK